MFNLFKKKNAKVLLFDSLQKLFLETVINALIEKYPIFKQQLMSGTFVGIGNNPGGSKHSYTYFLDNEKWKKFCNPNSDNFDIKNIQFNGSKNELITVDLFISEGLIIGYKSSHDLSEIILDTIDISKIWEKHFLNSDFEKIKHVFDGASGEKLKMFNMIKNTFEIRINNEKYYPIHELGNGDYFAINISGGFFAQIDPSRSR